MRKGSSQIGSRFARTALVLSAASAALASPGDWPQFRGPNRDGASAETGLLQDLPPGGPPLVWKATGLGAGYSTVSVVGNRIYTSGEDNEFSSVTALNAADGKKVWSSRLGKAGAAGLPPYEGPRATPTVEGDLLVAVGQWGELACLETAQGKELWRKHYTKDFGGKRPKWGFSESPLIDGDKVVITPGGTGGSVVALEQETGAVLWRSRGLHRRAALLLAHRRGNRRCAAVHPTDRRKRGGHCGGGRQTALARAAQGPDRRHSHADLQRRVRLCQLRLRHRLQPVQDHRSRRQVHRRSRSMPTK